MTPSQLEELSQFFPDQFIMPTETWQWKLGWSSLEGSSSPSKPVPPPLCAVPAVLSIEDAPGLRTATISAGELTAALVAQLLALLSHEPSVAEVPLTLTLALATLTVALALTLTLTLTLALALALTLTLTLTLTLALALTLTLAGRRPLERALGRRGNPRLR